MTMIELEDGTFEKLKNILIWAALWDIHQNNDKNRAVYDEVLGALRLP